MKGLLVLWFSFSERCLYGLLEEYPVLNMQIAVVAWDQGTYTFLVVTFFHLEDMQRGTGCI